MKMEGKMSIGIKNKKRTKKWQKIESLNSSMVQYHITWIPQPTKNLYNYEFSME